MMMVRLIKKSQGRNSFNRCSWDRLWNVGSSQKFGSMPWKTLLKPAIRLAEEGFIMSPFMVDALNKRYKKLSNYKNFKKYFIKTFLCK